MDHQYGENGARNIYSNYNQMRAYVECSPNQSKKIIPYRRFHLAIDETLKIPKRESAGRFCVQILPEYSSSALPAHAYKMVINTVCVQIDNCFCNT